MVGKVLKKMEILRGFIQIPAESESELIGNIRLPCSTLLNGNPARLDKYGRLWSPYLKNRFSIGTEVELNKIENGYQVVVHGSEDERSASEMRQQNEVTLASPSLESKTNAYWKVLEGDCLKYLDEGAINNIHLTFLDPPYRQGKNYRFFDDSQPASKYWSWLKEILHRVFDATVDGGAIYFMQREKNTEQVLRVLRKIGWRFQNLIV